MSAASAASPDTKPRTAASMMASPWPPASTTPASRSTRSIVGVLATASTAASWVALPSSWTPPPESTTLCAASATLDMTVSIVPSTGSATDL